MPFNLLSLLDSLLRSVAVAIIGGYQHHLSPRKGYSCSHRIVYGGDSCSEYVKKTLADKSLVEATLLARQRFKECNITYTSSKNRVVESNGSVIVSVGPDTDIIQWIISIIVAIFALIFGRNSGCCK
jgi:putative component of membrane protein insertase Oxa1/YidC/SpoIIIJ protein YidD